MKNFDLVVTRHTGLVEFLSQQGAVSSNVPVVSHASTEVLEGKNVVGVLPLHLAAATNTATELKLDLPVELRGKELTAEQLAQYSKGTATYTVIKHHDSITECGKVIGVNDNEVWSSQRLHHNIMFRDEPFAVEVLDGGTVVAAKSNDWTYVLEKPTKQAIATLLLLNQLQDTPFEGCVYCGSDQCIAYTHGESVCG